MADLSAGLSALGGQSYIPFSGYSRDNLSVKDAELIASDPEKEFAALLQNKKEIKAEDGSVSSTIKNKKPVIDKTSKLYESCEALEAFLIKNLLSSMRSTVQKSGLIEEGFAGGMYEDMLYDEYAKDFTKNSSFGFAQTAYLELTGQRGKILTRYA
ncbi:hypothetical protein FACS1894147_00080 [Spirochaetia bacterium]|nr:hypothetical protein FACS1894147_00080 [Spirochaetia bacterium]